MKYRESEEMYLETILLLKKKKPSLHSVDIAAELGYSRASVSRAVNLLQKNGYVIVALSGEIYLTDAGMKKATGVYERHKVITDVLVKIGAPQEMAEENACRFEHVVTDDLLLVMKNFLK